MSQEMTSGYRLSPEQTHLWMLRLFDRCAVCAVQIEGELRLEDLQRAIRHVVSRHEILRTAFKLLPGMTIPVQVISETPDFAFANHDFAELAVSDQDRQVSALLADARERKAGYEQLPLFRVDLIKRSSREHVLIISLPVICADVQSLQCLVSQIAAAYAVSSQTQPADVEVLQYADFAEWKNELREAEAGSAGQRYWRQHDLSELDTVKLSFEKRVGAATTFQPAGQSVDISPAVSAAIRMLASRCEISVSSFFLACWQILISRLTGQTKVVFGLGVEGRKFAELEQSIGLFATFVPVRSEFLPNLPFEKFVKQMSAQELEAQRYQEYFTWENAGSDEAGERFFPFSFEFHKAATSWKNEALEFLIYQREACTDRFKIKFVVEDGEDRFSAALQFDESLFSSDDVRRLADQLSTLVQDAANRTNAPLNALELLGNAERQLLLVDLNNTLRQYSSGKLVHELFEEQAQDRPNESAVVFKAERLTYRDLNSRANQLAHHLIKLGVGPDVTVGLCLERSTDLIVALLGIMKAGGAYVPLDPGLLKSRLKMILEEAGVRVLVTRSTLAKLLGEYVESVVSLDEEAQVLAEENSSNPPRRALEENLAYVIFTSGSTGRPKGVAVEHRQLANYVNAVWEKLELPEGGSFAMVSTISADLGNTALFPALCKKGTLHLIAEERSTNAEALADYFSSNQIDCLKIVPTHLSALLAAGNAAAILPRRRLILGGDASSWSLVERIHSLSKDCEILNHYGPTETTVGALTHKIQSEHLQWLSDTVPLGRPLGNVQTYILDEELRPVPIGAPGEVHIGGAGLARGYINRPDATAEKFIPNPFSASGGRLYKTGDRARYLGDGQIEFLGRNDNQVKVHGYRIELGEIEIALRGHEDVTDSIVIAREDIRGLRQLVAYLVPREGKKLTSGELRAFLNEKLPEYMVPTSFVFLERIPLTLNGKVDRNALPAPDHLQGDGDRVFTAPRTDVEKTLVEIWSNVLGLERVGVHDNFFDLGGDSILSIQIVARASQAGLRLMPRQLFQHQTVADLAAVVGSVGPAEQGLVTGRVPLTPVQARFFELDQPELHHYNQAMLLEVKGRADAAIFEQAIELLLVQHDALRFRYQKNHDGWEQTVAAPERVAPFERIDLSAMAEAEQTTRMSEHAATLQASLNLQHGPLMRVVLFDRGQQSSYLLVVIHHLVVDGVSWRILLEDLHTLYQQLSLRQEPSLPAKTTSFKNWAQGLTEYAKSAELREELAYWCGQLGEKPRVRLPLDNPNGTNTVASARTISVSLNVDETRELLQALPVAYRTQVNEVLLTALVRAVTAWTKGGSALLDLEGHGREEIIDGVNLSRTVGWFTTIFPVLLDCKNSQVETLRSVKEQLRKIPNRGIGYGLLKYTADDANAAGTLRALPQAEMRFNYLGQIDRVFVDSPMFATAPHQTGPAQSPKADRAYLLNIIAMVTGGELRLQWTYSENIHRHETIQRLAESHLHELRMLIEQSRTGGESVYSPSDFPSANLTKEDLDKVLARMRR
jgi:amino acid adenylation domain-containing protein/non-ribosomal peptide synthase protein (TIGR01720 family)